MRRIWLLLCSYLMIAWTCSFAQDKPYDLLLRGGTVIDPKNGIFEKRDVAIRSGKIAAVEPSIPPSKARLVVDVSGLYVTPGAIDIHTHLFTSTGLPNSWAGDSSVQPDAFSFRSCATTMVDAGSSGWRTFEMFRALVIDRARTRVLAFINISGHGMTSDLAEQGDFNPEAVAELARKHRDVVVGVKAAHYMKSDWECVDNALKAGELAGIPVMVDFGWFRPERPYWKLVTEKLRPGDISTHMYRSAVPYVDPQGKLYQYLWDARKRGVKFDVGHGGGSFVFRNAVPAVKQGFYPDTISTDLHAGSMNGAMIDLPTTMSKFLAMGMSLEDVILRVTWNPAKVIHREDLGHLSVGADADLAVWRLDRGKFGFADVAGGKLEGTQRLFCELTVREGRIVWDWNARAATDFTKLAPNYGMREVDVIVPPPQNH